MGCGVSEQEKPWMCDTCGGSAETHSLVDVIFCTYGDAETKAGEPLGRQGAEDIADRVATKFRRLMGLDE